MWTNVFKITEFSICGEKWIYRRLRRALKDAKTVQHYESIGLLYIHFLVLDLRVLSCLGGELLS